MRLGRLFRIARKLPQAVAGVFANGVSIGYCPVCDRRTGFVLEQPWHREYYRCVRCFSSARMRSFMHVLDTEFPNWRNLSVHESSPAGPVAEKLARACAQYTSSHYFANVTLGSTVEGRRCENLENLTFADSIFDLFITQDVIEHVMNPARAFAEIARVLKPGGAHVFSVPWLKSRVTELRAVLKAGQIQYLKKPEYHGNPIDPDGSLVVTDWGADMADIIYEHSGMQTNTFSPNDGTLGIIGDCLEVFVAYKNRFENSDDSPGYVARIKNRTLATE